MIPMGGVVCLMIVTLTSGMVMFGWGLHYVRVGCNRRVGTVVVHVGPTSALGTCEVTVQYTTHTGAIHAFSLRRICQPYGEDAVGMNVVGCYNDGRPQKLDTSAEGIMSRRTATLLLWIGAACTAMSTLWLAGVLVYEHCQRARESRRRRIRTRQWCDMLAPGVVIGVPVTVMMPMYGVSDTNVVVHEL